MGSKSTKKTTYNEQQTAAPPSWTLPGIQQTAGMVTDALNQSRQVGPYTGDFVAVPNTTLVNRALGQYGEAAAASGTAGQQLWNWASQAANGGQAAPTLSGMSDLLALMPSYDQLVGTQNILAAPDFAGMRPTMAAAPTFRGFNPTDFAPDSGGARLDAALSAATQPFVRELMQTILPGITSSAIDAGAYSGDRAMAILPQMAIADTATRANEVTAGLAYQGFQQEEARRLAAWQAMQELGLASATAENNFNTNIWSGTNDFNATLFDILAGAEASAFATRQGAATSQANNLANSLVQMYGINADAMQGFNNTSLNAWNLGEQNRRANLGLGADLLNNSLMATTAQGDITSQMINMLLGRDQAMLDNAMARNQYDITQPFQGLDIATNLLTALSGNWGEQTVNGSRRETTSTSGLGSIIQGLAGVAGMAASMGAFGPLGAATTAARAASPISSAIFGGGARAGMSG